jgi:hypothetical protein
MTRFASGARSDRCLAFVAVLMGAYPIADVTFPVAGAWSYCAGPEIVR